MKVIKILSVFLILVVEVIPIEIELQEGEEIKGNRVDGGLNDCISVRRSTEVGVCFGKELLSKLNTYDEADAFSLATGVSFVRDEKTPRDIGAFLDKDPMDFRSMLEDAGNLIAKRSLHWDLSGVYPGLVMKIGPTLSNGVLEFVMDPRVKDRAYQQPSEVSTGRLLARNLLVPFLLGFKFQLSTLLPLLLGLVLIASKKAFLLAKVALLAVTVFSSGWGSQSSYGGFGTPSLSSYSSYETPGHYHDHHDHHSSGGYYRRQPHPDYYYREKEPEPSTASPITPDELRDRLERLFVTKKENMNDARDRDDVSSRNVRNFAWTPINTG
ncbi:uncharacterized protein LOC113498682 [Trichoplusia ni]|uniref:Uncharacterized protein LOC113498682 n=1 Tax=Trichoplusia ni TaxID=7111 RepID=A0A7E5W1W3_TRINI|nr:uncharacterized protein LOC113498682 [Trichoplusia ni]